MSRTDPQLPDPDDVTDFPRKLIKKARLYRSHQARNDDGSPRSPWWFSSDPSDPGEGGRFDLPEPRGTCYLAYDTETALREHFGPTVLKHKVLTEAAVSKIAVSRLDLQQPVPVADTGAKEAANFVPRELVTTTDYACTRKWARAFAAAGAQGVLYESRFTTVPETNALALFGGAGLRDWPILGTEDVGAALREAGIKVVPSAGPVASYTKAAKRPPLSKA